MCKGSVRGKCKKCLEEMGEGSRRRVFLKVARHRGHRMATNQASAVCVARKQQDELISLLVSSRPRMPNLTAGIYTERHDMRFYFSYMKRYDIKHRTHS